MNTEAAAAAINGDCRADARNDKLCKILSCLSMLKGIWIIMELLSKRPLTAVF
jgi:hypothetical protein